MKSSLAKTQEVFVQEVREAFHRELGKSPDEVLIPLFSSPAGFHDIRLKVAGTLMHLPDIAEELFEGSEFIREEDPIEQLFVLIDHLGEGDTEAFEEREKKESEQWKIKKPKRKKKGKEVTAEEHQGRKVSKRLKDLSARALQTSEFQQFVKEQSPPKPLPKSPPLEVLKGQKKQAILEIIRSVDGISQEEMLQRVQLLGLSVEKPELITILTVLSGMEQVQLGKRGLFYGVKEGVAI